VVVIEAYDRMVTAHPDWSLREAMLAATDDMVGPMVGGTLTIVVVFLPFSLLEKQTQLLFAGISFVVTASLFASLFIALTIVPALGSLIHPEAAPEPEWDLRAQAWWGNARDRLTLLLPSREKGGMRDGFGVWMKRPSLTSVLSLEGRGRKARLLVVTAIPIISFLHFLIKVPWVQSLYVLVAAALVLTGLPLVLDYGSNLPRALHHRRVVLGVVGTVFAFGVAIFLFSLPKDFMASSEQNEFVVYVELDTGVRLDISNQAVSDVEKAVREFPGTRSAIRNISSKVEGWSSKIYVTLNDRARRTVSTQEVINALRPVVDKAIGKYEHEYKAFCYFSEPRTGKELIVEIFGYEYDLMAKLAMDVAGRMGKISGLSDVKIRYRPGRPQLSLYVDPLRASLFGLDTKEIAESLHAQMRGLRATTFYDEAQEVETVVRVRPDQHETVDQMKTLILHAPVGGSIPLAQVVEVRGDLSPSEIWHRNRARMIQVSANLGTTSLESAAGRVRAAISKISFPPEYYADIGGQFEEMTAANRDFWRALVLTVFLVFMVMACQFESYAQPLVIMGTVLLSLIGAVAALCLCGTTVTMGVSVGLLMLGGIVVNNGIMLMDRMNVLRRENPERASPDLLRQAGLERIRPIFMTKVTTLLGLLPMAMDRSESASLWSPLSITVVGGLVSASLLTLFVIPCLYLSLEDILKAIRNWDASFFTRFAKKLLPPRWGTIGPMRPWTDGQASSESKGSSEVGMGVFGE